MRTRTSDPSRLTVVNFPIAFGMKSYLKEAVLGIVALTAAGADPVTTPGGSLTIIVLRHGERGAAAAWDQKHAEGAPSLAGIG
jgi:hypothetical protein